MSEEVSIHRLSKRHRFRIWFVRTVRHWPFVVWVALGALALWSISHTEVEETVPGLVEYSKRTLVPKESGYIETLEVELGEPFQAGQLLVSMRSAALNSEIAEAESDIVDAESKLSLEAFLRSSELRHSEEKLVLEGKEAESELEVLLAERERLQGLKSSGLIDTGMIVSNERKIASLRFLVSTLDERLSALKAEQADFNALIEEARSRQKISKETLLNTLKERRESLDLTAESEGSVATVYRKKGDFVRAGEPILDLVEKERPQVVGFVGHDGTQNLFEGERVEVNLTGTQLAPIAGKVVRVLPKIGSVEDKSNPIMARSVRGILFVVDLEEDVPWLDGQQVEIALEAGANSPLQTWWDQILSVIGLGSSQS
ncbi:HlyD family secretion protein [Pelagicoccus albus]|uniref:HlyD family efflux transporter periplasmic adaptor subunit n=1 Tax=Pelagicoccus albus TaxID=415222 RepID=A0A7X1B5R5_9BACT|nr:HlyD family efflux transporter periplasmic adaptor subunit [Pelagicoccus albus]MBC2606166.1 HlyD family efflux transporter periplasmic adaptor subunit [Pelagicoccus albus]